MNVLFYQYNIGFVRILKYKWKAFFIFKLKIYKPMTRLKPFENVIDVKRVTTVEASRMVRQLHLAASMKVRHGSHKEINDNILGRTTIMYDFSNRIPADTKMYAIFLATLLRLLSAPVRGKIYFRPKCMIARQNEGLYPILALLCHSYSGCVSRLGRA